MIQAEMPAAVQRLVAFAADVRKRLDTTGLPPGGSCREVALAISLAFDTPDSIVAVCYGMVRVDSDFRPHWWCRLDGWIVDATADQFKHGSPVISKPESELSHYKEDFYLCMQRRQVLSLAGIDLGSLHRPPPSSCHGFGSANP